MKLEQLVQQTSQLTLLYAEDEEILRISTMAVLEDIFGNIFVASNGKEALEIYQNNKIDIIITDLNMPIISGREMIMEIRKKNLRVPILVFSGDKEQELKTQFQSYNISGYLQKPLSLEQFLDEFTKLLD